MSEAVRQDPLWNEKCLPATTLWTDALDNRGVLAQPSLPDDGRQFEGMNRVTTTAEVAEHIGQLIAPLHAKAVLAYEAPELNVGHEDLKNVRVNEIKRGLYVPVHGARFRGVRQAVRVYGGHTDLALKGVVSPDIAVVFHEDDHKRLAHSHVYLGNHSYSTTLSANPILQNSGNRTERDRKSISSIAKTMASKIQAIDKFSAELEECRDFMRSVHRSFRHNPGIHYLPSNAAEILRRADTEIRRVVETSGTQRGLTPEERAGAQRALTVNLYQRGQWRDYTGLVGQYFNAQLGKLDESRNACVASYDQTRAAIKPEEVAAFDAIVHPLPDQQLELAA